MKKITFFLVTIALLGSNTIMASMSLTEPVAKSKTESTLSKEVVFDDAVAMDALREFKSLSRVDRQMRIKEAKKAVKAFKAQKAAGEVASTNTVLLVILALILPPLAVYLHEGTINGKFWLSLLLTLLFWIPGVIYALIVVLG